MQGDLSLLRVKVKNDLIQHQLRESFREWHFNKFSCADYVEWARKRACENFAFFQVLTGALVSPACSAKMRATEVSSCPFCNDPPAVPARDHLVWFCQGGRFHQSRLDSLGFSPPESPPAPWPPWPSGWIR